MDNLNLKQRVKLYHNFDVARQQDLEQIADEFEKLERDFRNLKADLEDEQATRRNWRRRAEEAEDSTSRNHFALVLIDGDGYFFKEAFLKEAIDGGGARAAYELYSQILQYLKANELPETTQIMVNVYANRSGLARHLCDADILHVPSQLDQFFCSFSQTQSLFSFIDCGYGKERADAKLRDTYRFYAYNAQCKSIFLACCHDNGYVAELDKYRHDPVAAPKTILVHAAQAARQYSNLPFPVARLDTVFETQPPQIIKKDHTPPIIETQPDNDAASQASHEAIVSAAPPQTWSAVTTSHGSMDPTTQSFRASSATKAESDAGAKGIAINRAGQRIDLKLRNPSERELDAFENRITVRKLCNRHHLANDCVAAYKCKFDHDPIDNSMKNTLRVKARSIPCLQGQYCRQADCFYGHQCPWGRACQNKACTFHKKDMHDVKDTEIAKLVPAEY